MLDTRHRGVDGGQRARVSSGQRTQRGRCWTQDTEGWMVDREHGSVVDREHRGVSSGQRTQRGEWWTESTEE